MTICKIQFISHSLVFTFVWPLTLASGCTIHISLTVLQYCWLWYQKLMKHVKMLLTTTILHNLQINLLEDLKHFIGFSDIPAKSKIGIKKGIEEISHTIVIAIPALHSLYSCLVLFSSYFRTNTTFSVEF